MKANNSKTRNYRLVMLLISLGCCWRLAAQESDIVTKDNLTITKQLVTQTQAAQQASFEQDKSRLQQHEKSEQQSSEQVATAQAEQQRLTHSIAQLNAQIKQNDADNAELKAQLVEKTANINQLPSLLNRVASELITAREHAPISASNAAFSPLLTELTAIDYLPTPKQLDALWQGLMRDLQLSARIENQDITTRNQDGTFSQQHVLRVGNVGFFTPSHLFQWQNTHNQADQLPLPTHYVLPKMLTHIQAGDWLSFDPSGGAILQQQAAEPTLLERLQQGGSIGIIIAILLALGLGISAIRARQLIGTERAIKRQLTTSECLPNNPLGRLLTLYHQNPNTSLDRLELKLMEVILDEQQRLNKGLSMLKLLASLAPMLGLLGTVTGMIQTFQAIGQTTNNAGLMAQGISTALITTVMGIVAAIPLLLLHNLLSTKAEYLHGLLEKKGIGLVAEHAEQYALTKASNAQ